MTKEELEREYYGRRPTEPYSEDDSPNDWANIVQYAEENLGKAFKAIAELEKENAELRRDKEDLIFIRNQNAKCRCEDKENLTKAKEIIKDYMTIVKGNHITVCGVLEENRTIYVLKLNEEAEEFLNCEVEE